MLPSPPVLKTTIIQLNKELESEEGNYEILTNEYHKKSDAAAGGSGKAVTHRKKRRRSSANVDEEELAKRKNETKQLHSIIEKKRRIKINREFEALKYLIPACRTTTSSSANSPTFKPVNASSNNGNKIDGMYKLTILKSSVEYILYLHHIIRKQHEMLQKDPGYDFDINFASIPLDVNQYRDIDKDFSFKHLASELDANFGTIHENDDESDSSLQLISPDVTPNIAPKQARKNSIPISPFTVPKKKEEAKKNENDYYGNRFALPDPMINPSAKLPKKLLFKSRPINESVVISNDPDRRLSDHDASTTLLALRRSNIDSLLN